MPVLLGPSVYIIARATVCAGPSPPPSPSAPIPVHVTRTSLRLFWENPPFDGSPPTSYELQSCGDRRNNQQWVNVFPASFPRVAAPTVNIPRRVPGLGLRYRVRASNQGGWGDFSPSSELITTRSWLHDDGKDAVSTMATLAR